MAFGLSQVIYRIFRDNKIDCAKENDENIWVISKNSNKNYKFCEDNHDSNVIMIGLKT